MKKPQRAFVVEFKSSRSQLKPRKNSIWGDTDFKALSLEVEKLALMPKEIEAEAVAKTVNVETEPAAAKPVSEIAIGSDAQVALDADGAQPSSLSSQVDEPGDQVVEAQATPTVPKADLPIEMPAVDKVLRARKRPPLRARAAKPEAADETASLNFTTPDYLVVLEEENRFLKQAFAAKLRADNEQLHAMILRTDSRVVSML